MPNREQETTPTPSRIPMFALLREMLWLPTLSHWGIVGTVLFIAVLGGAILLLLLVSSAP